MAKNYDVKLDSDNFMSSFSENAEPTFTPAPSKKKPNSEKDCPHDESLPRQPAGNRETRGAPTTDYTREEMDFIEKYVTRTRFTKVSQNGKQVSVSDRHLKKIRKLTLLFGDGATLSGYLYNVLEEHFKQYDPILQSLLMKELTKD